MVCLPQPTFAPPSPPDPVGLEMWLAPGAGDHGEMAGTNGKKVKKKCGDGHIAPMLLLVLVQRPTSIVPA